jgi:hypothetical protein
VRPPLVVAAAPQSENARPEQHLAGLSVVSRRLGGGGADDRQVTETGERSTGPGVLGSCGVVKVRFREQPAPF